MNNYKKLFFAMMLAHIVNVDAGESAGSALKNEVHIDEKSGKCVGKYGDITFTDPLTGEVIGKDGELIAAAGYCDYLYTQWAKRPLKLHECILDEMPAMQNDVAARKTYAECKKRYGIERTTTRSFSVFGPSTRSECTRKYTPGTSSSMAARMMSSACNALYEE